jgi:SET domain-containing protein
MAAQSWISPKTARNQPSAIAGVGFFAIEPIQKGEIIAVKAGHIIDKATLATTKDIIRDSEMQITNDLNLAPLTEEECRQSMISINHSCDPDAGIAGSTMLVAKRDIPAGREITVDYAMHYSDLGYSMECNCRSVNCRKVITGNDWQIPELQERYSGYFSWYIQQKSMAYQSKLMGSMS